LLSEKYEEPKLKFESINDTNDSLETSNSCNKKCHEDVFVESCDDLIAKENDDLKQEVEKLMKDLARLKGKSIESNVQPSQDNREDIVKKLEKGCTVTCSKCHQKGHKSNKCPQQKKKLSDEKNKKKLTIKSSLIYTKPNRRNNSHSTTYVIKKKINGKVVAHKVGKQERSWNHSIWVPKDVITNMKGPQMVWVPKET